MLLLALLQLDPDWLTNMAVHHRYTLAEMAAATGRSEAEIAERLEHWKIGGPPPARPAGAPLLMLPYPGGRHPRVGFLDGAVNPRRETKLSVFAPWGGYAVVDVPEAIWEGGELIWLAHEHIPTRWDKRAIALARGEWERRKDGTLLLERRLPDGITFGARATATPEALLMELWLKNDSARTLTGLRVQNCVLLRGLPGFEAQTLMRSPYAACRSGNRWIITAWEPADRLWANAPCPCIHSDPKFADCPPGETRRLKGRLWFTEGPDIDAELARIEATGWRTESRLEGRLALPARVTLSDRRLPLGGVPYRKERGASVEVHATVDGTFEAMLPPGRHTITVERGKEYRTLTREVEIGADPVIVDLPLSRWIDMAARGWYSGETHVHRPLADLPALMMAEDLNVAFPLTSWVRDAFKEPPAPPEARELVRLDATHVYWPRNTEYEFFNVDGKSHTLGAFFVLGHRGRAPGGVPPLAGALAWARSEGALLELDKHNWPWSMALVPHMPEVLYELSNNHVWRTEFGFEGWGEAPAPYMKTEKGYAGWIDFGLQNYYALLNAGFRLSPTAGTASGVHPVPLGFSRVYVHLPEGFSYEGWVRGLRQGRSFVTTGPMLLAHVRDSDPGRRFTRPGDYRVRGEALYDGPIDRVEILVNGNVVKQPAGSAFDETLRIEGTSWIAVRCYAKDRFAHTAPWFVDIEGRPLRPRPEERQYLIDRVAAQIERSAALLPPAALEEYRAALETYRRLETDP